MPTTHVFTATHLSAMLEGLSPMGTSIPPQREAENTCGHRDTRPLSPFLSLR